MSLNPSLSKSFFGFLAVKVPEKGKEGGDKGEHKRNANKQKLEQINTTRKILVIAPINLLLRHALLRVNNSLFPSWWQ